MSELMRVLRSLRRTPSFAIAVVLLLVLATGANTAIFTVARAVLLRPLPWPAADRLAAVWEAGPGEFRREIGVGLPDYFDWRRQADLFESLAAYGTAGFNLATAGEPEHVEAIIASANLLPLLGGEPRLGRNFRPAEEQPGEGRPVILGHALWQRRFAADPSTVGRQVTIAGEPYTVIGILPADLHLPVDADILLPLGQYSGNVRIWRSSHPLTVLGRVRAGVSLRAAEEQLAAKARALWEAEETAEAWNGWSVRLVPLAAQLFGKYRQTVRTLWLAVGLVLLVTAANLANLFLARLAARQRELAVRTALGAGSLRILALLAAEGLVLTLAGLLCGLAAARLAIRALVPLLPRALAHLGDLRIDSQVTGYAVAMALGVVALALAVAAARQGFSSLQRTLAAGSRSTTRRPSRSLVVAQLALAVPLVVAALLLVGTIRNLRRADSGIAPGAALSFRVVIPSARYPTPADRQAFFERVEERLAGLPGVRAAGFGSNIPLSRLGTNSSTSVFVEGRSRDDGSVRDAADVRVVSAGYFEALGMRLVRGRLLGHADAGGPRAAVVNQRMAARTWPGSDPIGQRILDGNEPAFDEGDAGRWFTVVGIVEDARSDGVRAEPVSEVYLPFAKRPLRAMTFVVRTAAAPGLLAPLVRREVAAVDPQQPVFDVVTLDELADESIVRERLALSLLVALASLALAVAAVGVYGVVTFTVSAGWRELGVRSALGARAVDLLRHVLGETATLALAGGALGSILALAGGRLLAEVVYGVDATDPRLVAAVVGVTLLVGLLAALAPAVRAARISPSAVLRQED